MPLNRRDDWEHATLLLARDAGVWTVYMKGVRMQKHNLERVCALPMFSGVSLVDVRCVLTEARARVRTFRRHETVFAMQSEVRHVFVVLSGALKISEYGEKGVSHILRIADQDMSLDWHIYWGTLLCSQALALRLRPVRFWSWILLDFTGRWRIFGTDRLAKISSG